MDETCRRVARGVRAAAKLVPQSTCLVQALTLQKLLARAGIHARLRVGVAKRDGSSIEAHAWVEYHGRILIGGKVEGFTPLAELRSMPEQ